MGASTLALAAFEVAIRCGGAALAWLQDVRVHAEAHGAPGHTPVEPGVDEHLIKSLRFCLHLDAGGAGDDHGVNVGTDLTALDDAGGGAQVVDAGIGAGSQEHAVDFDVLDGLVGFQTHVFQCAFGSFLFGSRAERRRVGHAVGDWHHHVGLGPPGHERRQFNCRDDDRLVVGGARVGGEAAPFFNLRFQFGALGSVGTRADVLKCGFIGSNHAGAGAGLDAHVAHRHASVHRQATDGFAGVLDHVAGAAVDADTPDDTEYDVFGGHPAGQRAINADFHGLRFGLAERLRGQHVFNFRRADADRKTAQRTVSGGMAVSAYYRLAGKGVAQVRADHVDDALILTEAVVIVG